MKYQTQKVRITTPEGDTWIPMYVSSTLPDEFRKVALQDDHETQGEYSVTELLDDPRCAALRKQNPELTGTADELLHSLFGKALHKYFEDRLESPKPGVVLETEKHFMFEVDGHKISGTCDELMLSSDTLIIGDIKNWTVFKWMSQEFNDLFWQLQIYRYAWSQMNDNKRMSAEWIRGILFFKDRNRKDAAIHKEKYPPSQGLQINFSTLPNDQVERYIRNRLNHHLVIKGLPESEWPDAHPSKVWQKTTSFKIYKSGGRRAVSGGVFDVRDYDSINSAKAAATLLLNKKGADHELIEIKSPRKRCQDYCPVSNKCTAWQEYQKKEAMSTNSFTTGSKK